MEYLISNLKKSLGCDVPLLTLIGAFSLIDIIATHDTEKGVASKQNFITWFKKYLPNYIAMDITAEDYYVFRCALLHQLSGSQEYTTSIPTLLFFYKDSPIQGHMNRINGALNLDLITFVNDVIDATEQCIKQSEYCSKHENRIIKLHPNGLFPFASGIPVIASAMAARAPKQIGMSAESC